MLLSTVFQETPEYGRVMSFCGELERRYRFVRLETVGKSVLGRDIPALCFGVEQGGGLYVGGTHANEYITVSLLLRFAERLCETVDSGSTLRGVDCRRALLAGGLTIVPVLNPDGVELVLGGAETAGELAQSVLEISGGDFSGWSANAAGVDLNHTFDAGWHIAKSLELAAGIDSPSPRRYGGERPESQPETQAIVSLCEKRSFGLCIALHTQGEEIYWKYGERTPPASRLMARMLAFSTGYAISEPVAIASHAGLKDWFIEKYGMPGFTIECGRGKNPLPFSQAEEIYGRIEEALLLGMIM